MKVFVTGGTGFLGGFVIESLIAAKHAVRAMVRSPHARLPQGAEAVQVGLTDLAELTDAVRGCDAVIHMAGKVSRDAADGAAMHDLHVNGTRVLLRAMVDAGVRRMVLASTSGTIAVRKHAGKPATESDEAAIDIIGRWPYYMSKRLQEQEVLRWDADDEIEAVILNPSLLLGPGDDRMSSTGDVLKILHGRVPAVTEGTVAFVDTRDCGPAFVAALARGPRGQRYLINGANMSVRNFFERIAIAGDVSPPRMKLADRWAVLGARVLEGAYQAFDRIPPMDAVSVEMGCHDWGCSWAKAEAELGFAPRDPNATISATVRDLEKRGLFRR